jgi:hypothetical protein
MKAHERMLPWEELTERLTELEVALATNNIRIIRQLLKTLVTGYQPTADIVDWVHLERRKHLREVTAPEQDMICATGVS